MWLSVLVSGCEFWLVEHVTAVQPTNVSYYAQVRLPRLNTVHPLSWLLPKRNSLQEERDDKLTLKITSFILLCYTFPDNSIFSNTCFNRIFPYPGALYPFVCITAYPGFEGWKHCYRTESSDVFQHYMVLDLYKYVNMINMYLMEKWLYEFIALSPSRNILQMGIETQNYVMEL